MQVILSVFDSLYFADNYGNVVGDLYLITGSWRISGSVSNGDVTSVYMQYASNEMDVICV